MRRVLFLGLFLLCCGPAFRAPVGSLPYMFVPDWYVDEWEAAVLCSNVEGDYRDLEFYLVDNLVLAGNKLAGLYIPRNRIYLQRGFQEDERVVRHEMLHALLFPRSHKDPVFLHCDPLEIGR